MRHHPADRDGIDSPEDDEAPLEDEDADAEELFVSNAERFATDDCFPFRFDEDDIEYSEDENDEFYDGEGDADYDLDNLRIMQFREPSHSHGHPRGAASGKASSRRQYPTHN